MDFYNILVFMQSLVASMFRHMNEAAMIKHVQVLFKKVNYRLTLLFSEILFPKIFVFLFFTFNSVI